MTRLAEAPALLAARLPAGADRHSTRSPARGSSTITVRDGELYGALIDILRNSAPLMLVALGMTLVIATRGIDLSVGAVMAVTGAVTLTIIDGSANPEDIGTVLCRDRRRQSRSGSHWARGTAFWWPCFESNRSSRRWCSCSPVEEWPCSSRRASSPRSTAIRLEVRRQRVPVRASLRAVHLGRRHRHDRGVRAPHRSRRADRGGRHQSGGEPALRRAVAAESSSAPTSPVARWPESLASSTARTSWPRTPTRPVI